MKKLRELHNYVQRATYLPAVFCDLLQSVKPVLTAEHPKPLATHIIHLDEKHDLINVPAQEQPLVAIHLAILWSYVPKSQDQI